MKQSIAHLPKRKQSDLHHLVKAILAKLPQTEMIILYGSYARGKFVEYDERVEFGIPTYFLSDYDILVVTHGIKDWEAAHILDNVEDRYTNGSDFQTPVQFINQDIERLNEDLSAGRYFYTELKRDGILLYDSGKFKLARRRKLKFDEIGHQAEEYYVDKTKKAQEFFIDAKASYGRGSYTQSSFYLHQTCENLFYATRLTFTLRNPKQHNLTKLLNSVRKYSPEFVDLFPRRTAEEKRLFELLKSAYIESRYNPQFLVTKEDIDPLMAIVSQLFDLVKNTCEERIREYAKMK